MDKSNTKNDFHNTAAGKPRLRLTPNEEVFVRKITEGKSQRVAYKEAYATGRMSDKLVDAKASQLAATPLVQNKLYQLSKKLKLSGQKPKVVITADDVLGELQYVAFSRMTDVIRLEHHKVVVDYERTKGGKPIKSKPICRDRGHIVMLPSEEWPERASASVSSLQETRNGMKVSMHDKLKALELLGRHFGLFIEKNEQTTNIVQLGVVLAKQLDTLSMGQLEAIAAGNIALDDLAKLEQDKSTLNVDDYTDASVQVDDERRE